MGCPHPAQGVTSWFIFSLIKGRGVPGAEAAVRISGLELGGLLGSLSAGAISDRLIKSNTDPNVGNVGLRVKVAPLTLEDLISRCQSRPVYGAVQSRIENGGCTPMCLDG
jgi:hypothetical protein